MKEIAQRGLKRKKEQDRKLVMLRIVTCKSFPDYTPVSIDEKLIPSGAD